MGKKPRARYTLEFKLEALRQIAAGQSVAVVSAVLGVRNTSNRGKVSHRTPVGTGVFEFLERGGHDVGIAEAKAQLHANFSWRPNATAVQLRHV